MFCRNCGKYVADTKTECPYCGSKSGMVKDTTSHIRRKDASSGAMAVLGFLVPIAGIILYCVWKDEYPQKADSCIKGALWSIVICVICCLLGFGFASCGAIKALNDYMKYFNTYN